ncbi:MAG: oxygen-independent coproporphyrinogen III oxidase-like protein, partial [Arenimonas sp.]
IGAGAHGKITSGESGQILRRWKPKNPRDFMQAAGTGIGIGGDEYVSPENRPFDYMLNALRLVDGFSLRDFEFRTGLGCEAIAPQLNEAVQRGWLEISGDGAKPTELGMRFANDVMGLFLR